MSIYGLLIGIGPYLLHECRPSSFGFSHQGSPQRIFFLKVSFSKLNNLRVKYMYSPDIRREPNVFNFVNIMQTNDPVTIGNLAKFILHGLKLYT